MSSIAARELVVVFGSRIIGFGGPAAHIALMRARWSSGGVAERRQLVDLVGVTNLIPGPNSTELAMHVGRLRAGGAGWSSPGSRFILPAATIVLASRGST